MSDDEKPKLPRPGQRWAVKITTDTFRKIKNDPEFCALVALARAVNALHSVLAMLMDAGVENSPKAFRARSNSLAFTCALFAEAVPLIEGMQRYFKTHPAFQKIAGVIHSDEAKELRDGSLARLRNKLVFHFDASEVLEQMKTLDRENPIFVSGMGHSKENTYYELADIVALRTFFGAAFPFDLKDSHVKLQKVASVVLSFLNAADELLVVVMTERGWADMQLYD
jgi:hypothetical protein